MGDLSTWLQNLFGGGGESAVNGTVPTMPTLQQISPTAGPNEYNTDSLSSILGGSNGMSGLQIGQLGLGAANGLLSGILGFNNLGVAKDQARQAQKNWDKQWGANVKSTNAALADRQKARVASNPNAYDSVDSYMKKYGIS